MLPVVLTVAGSDPSGGAGLQADLKTIQRLGGYGVSVATLITAQNTEAVHEVSLLSPTLVEAQLRWLLADVRPEAAKTGALGSVGVVESLAPFVRRTEFPWILDPVLAPSSGATLSEPGYLEALRTLLVPHAALVTPNLAEARALTGLEVETLEQAQLAAERIARLGARAVLVKGGHLSGADHSTDVLLVDGVHHELPPARVAEGRFHGTGCALSAAIATRLACGDPLEEAVVRAKAWLTEALGEAIAIGRGARIVNHAAALEDET